MAIVHVRFHTFSQNVNINRIPDERQREIEIYYVSYGSVYLFMRKIFFNRLECSVHDDVYLRKVMGGLTSLVIIEM